MSKSVEKASDEGQDGHQNDFVLDILYHDARRVGSFLSQFDDSGLLQQIIQRESAAKGKKRGFKVQVGGGATWLGTGGSGNVALERAPSDEGAEGSDRVYDPNWTNTLTLLDFLAAADLLRSDLASATIGQFVQIAGSLRIHDLGTVKRLWDLPMVKRQLRPSNPSTGHTGLNRKDRRRQAAQGGQQQGEPDAWELGMEIMKTLPHVISARIESHNGMRAWSSLREDGLTGSSSDLFLKHGANIAGNWSMVGILDATPDEDDEERELTPAEEAVAFLNNGFGHLLDTLGPPARSFLGRPASAFGITPIVIYRVVAG